MILQNQKLKNLNSLNNKFENFLFGMFPAAENGYYMSFFRIAIGLVAIIDAVSLIPDLELFFSKDKIIIPQELAYMSSDYVDFLNFFYNLFLKFGLVDFFYSYSIYIYLLFLSFMVIGFKTKVFAFLSLFFQILIFKSFDIFNYGFDNFLTMSLFYCLVFPVGKIYSVDNYYFKIKTQLKFPFRRFLQFHLCIVYMTSGVAKCLDPNWLDGNAIFRATRSIFRDIIDIPPLIFMIASLSVLFLELFYPFIFFNKLRKYFLFGIVAMHLGIAVVLELYSFALIMIIWNLAAFHTFKTTSNSEN